MGKTIGGGGRIIMADLSCLTRYQSVLLSLKPLESHEHLLLESSRRWRASSSSSESAAADITAFATALESTFPILNRFARCLQRPMEIPTKNEGKRRQIVNFRTAVIPSSGVTVPLGDIDVENAVLISDAFNVSEFHAIETLAGSAGRTTGTIDSEKDIDAQTRLFAAGNIFQERASCL